MAATQFAMAVLLVSGIPIDRSELDAIRMAVDSYLRGINGYHIAYTEEWSTTAERLDALRVEADEALQKNLQLIESHEQRKEYQETIERNKAKGEPVVIKVFDVIERYPSLRLRIRTERRYPNGETESESTESAYVEGQRYSLNHSNKEAVIKDASDRSNLLRLPIVTIGARIPGSINMPLTELLKYPTITSKPESGVVNGISVIRLRIGPGLPEAVRRPFGQLWNEETRVHIALAVDMNYVPIEIEILPENRGIVGKRSGRKVVHAQKADGSQGEFLSYRSFGTDYRLVPNPVTGKSLPFPYTAAYEDPAGTTVWKVTYVVLNPNLSRADFVPTVPDAYGLLTYGKEKKIRMKGGRPAYENRINSTVDEGRTVLSQPLPATSALTNDSWLRPSTALLLAALVTSGVVVSVTLIRRSKR